MLSTLRTAGRRQAHVGQRTMSSAAPAPVGGFLNTMFNKSKMPAVPLSEEFPTSGSSAIAPARNASHECETTTLANGLKVVSVDGNYPLTSVGCFINSGSRYENESNQGINSFMESIAFKSTYNRSDLRLVREMLSFGANVTCSSTREHMTYFGDSMRDYSHEVVATLGDVIRNAEFDSAEILEAKEAYSEAAAQKAQAADMAVMESIHAAGYYNNTLGRGTLASQHTLGSFNEESLIAHRETFYTPGNMVLAGTGIEHDHLVNLADKYFGSMTNPTDAKLLTDTLTAKAQYTGGDVRLHRPDEPLLHVAVAFETDGWHGKDLVPMCLLQMLMGGGGSFSAGGPGKGMYSRLYTDVLNKHHWVESITCFNSIFNDSALFGFYGLCAPENAAPMSEIMCTEAVKMTKNISAVELNRAKNQLKTAVQMHLDQRSMLCEDIGRQTIVYGSVDDAAAICAKIDQATANDLLRVAKTMTSKPVSISGVGDTSHMPRYDQYAQALK